jgi:hypothetical protein
MVFTRIFAAGRQLLLEIPSSSGSLPATAASGRDHLLQSLIIYESFFSRR